MSKKNFQKIKLLKIMEILKCESDEDYPLSTGDLLFKLKEQGIICDRRTLYNDIDVLNSYGYEIFKTRAKSNLYYVINRDFDIAELKILIDAVHAASFITEKKSKTLIDKIANIAGQYRANLLKNDIVCFHTIKHTNEKIFYHIDTINNGILLKKQISFLYFDYDIKGQRVYRKEKKRYLVNPVALIFSNDNYYLVCYSDKYKNISNYRVDRMDKVVLEASHINKAPCENNFETNKFRKQVFSMFTGDLEDVVIQAHNNMVDIVTDKFGEKLEMTYSDKEHFKINVKVQLSPTFYSWCCAFGEKLKVISPASVIKQIKEHIKEVAKNYE